MNAEPVAAQTRHTAPAVESCPPSPGSQDRPRVAGSPDDSRCRHRYANGKRCRLPAHPCRSGFCLRHYNIRAAAGLPLSNPPSDSEDLSSELLPELATPGSGLPINKFFARLLVLVTQGRITPRRAGVLCYLSNQLLRSPSLSKASKTKRAAWAVNL